MKKHKAIFLSSALTALVGAAVSAHAATVSPTWGPGPASMPISATGSMALSKNGQTVSCNTVLVGSVNPIGGVVTITSTTFSGSAQCNAVKGSATALVPWTGRFEAGMLSLDNVGVTAPDKGQCGPSPVTAKVTDNGTETAINFGPSSVLSGGCSIVSGTLTTTPYVHIGQ
jgi:hypothetical protein